MLLIIGLGLGAEKDITLRGLEAVHSCDKIYMEAFTSLLLSGLSSDGLYSLEKLCGKSITVADREMVGEKADEFLNQALESDVGFMVVGDLFGTTAHTGFVVRAKKLGVKVKLIYNASILIAVGVCGLQSYRYGQTVSVPFFTETLSPDSFYEKILQNRCLGLHTLCLLGIREKEPSLESLARGKKKYEPPRYMTINTAIEQLLEVEEIHGKRAYTEESKCVGLARIGHRDKMIVSGSMKDLRNVDFGAPLHYLVIVGDTHTLEDEMLEFYKVK